MNQVTELRIRQSTLKDWTQCRELYRLHHVIGLEPITPNIHYQFGSAIHIMCQSFWAGEDYMTAFSKALRCKNELDPRLLDSNQNKKWVEMCDKISPITSVYYETYKNHAERPVYNEYHFEEDWGTISGIKVILEGTIDRFFPSGILRDTKTASPVKETWWADLKKRLLREPQLPFYRRKCERDGHKVTAMQYEIVVKPTEGSFKKKAHDPEVKIMDVTEEFMANQEVWDQQTDWAIREIAEFYAHCLDAQPWPQSNSACTSMIWGECAYLPVCLGKSSTADSQLYKIGGNGNVKP